MLTYLPQGFVGYPLVYGMILIVLTLTLPFLIKMISLELLRGLIGQK